MAGTYTLRWTETNANGTECSDWDEVEVTFLKGTLADDYNIEAMPDIEAVVDVPAIIKASFNLPEPDTGADAEIIMDGLFYVDGGFPAGAEVIEVRRVAEITTTYFPVADADIGGEEYVLFSDLVGMQNPLFNNALNNYSWEITIAGIDEVIDFDVDFSLITYIDTPQDFDDDCYAMLDTKGFNMSFDEATILAEGDQACSDDALGFSVAITYPEIAYVDIDGDITLDAKITTDVEFNDGATLLWGYNAPADNASAVDIDGKTEIYLSEIVGGDPTALSGHSGTDTWNFEITGLDPGIYEIGFDGIA